MNHFYKPAFVHLHFLNISSSLLWKTSSKVRPQTRLHSWRITNVWIPIQLFNGVRPSSSAGVKQPQVIEEQNNVTEGEDVSQDSLAVLVFVLVITEGHHQMGFILHKQGDEDVYFCADTITDKIKQKQFDMLV